MDMIDISYVNWITYLINQNVIRTAQLISCLVYLRCLKAYWYFSDYNAKQFGFRVGMALYAAKIALRFFLGLSDDNEVAFWLIVFYLICCCLYKLVQVFDQVSSITLLD